MHDEFGLFRIKIIRINDFFVALFVVLLVTFFVAFLTTTALRFFLVVLALTLVLAFALTFGAGSKGSSVVGTSEDAAPVPSKPGPVAVGLSGVVPVSDELSVGKPTVSP